MKKIRLSFCIFICIILTACSINTHTKKNSIKGLEKKLAFINYSAGYSFGNSKTAKIIMVEYSSYECIDCRNLHKNIDSLLKKYINNGTLLYIYKPVNHPKFPNDKKINRYFAPKSLDDIQNIFDKFDYYSKKPYPTLKSVLNLSDKTVLNYDFVDKTISKELLVGNITGTPTMYINGTKYDKVFTKQEFQRILDSLIN
ncbi:hypothetical protein D4Z93_07835 [Clostridium fermenticellae]|uniref:Thioredoxin-like fold domain-containing protein n=1 Tax=Clostridium fermenticellae TaxID=2068654 RepID=A0A386H4F0_9CLOT|nr:thioredoxin domain-containing protein [Clostridium fermenticellae]AYD40438.1 hypothetical protein D4Z93_07835 [Clostridium fermenticellae]